MKRIFWIDDDIGVALPDVTFLKYHGYAVDIARNATEGIDWFAEHKLELGTHCAYIVDVQLPTDGDSRFSGDSRAVFAGLRICEILKSEVLTASEWEAVRQKLLLFTRLPNTQRMRRIQEFATANKIHFVHKSPTDSLLSQLASIGLVNVLG
jgi:CheY-like chemotaxis protein